MLNALVIDGNSLLYRCYYATVKQLDYYLNNNITPANAIKQFLLIFLRILSSKKYDYVCVAFDSGKATIRHQMCPTYKAKRIKTPIHLINQCNLVQQILIDSKIVVEKSDEYEADDIIGSFCELMSKNNIHTDVYSSDQDLLQLVSTNTSIHLIKNGGIYNEVNLEKFGQLFPFLTPKQFIDYKALIGDKSDNLPGANGIGHKIAIGLLQQFKNIQTLYSNINDVSKKNQDKLIASKADVFNCLKLVEIYCQIFKNTNPKYFLNIYDQNKMIESIKKYNFNLNNFHAYFK